MTVAVAVVQLAPVLGDLAGNRRRLLAAVDEAAAAGARVVVLPELATTGYCFTDAAQARALAEPVDGPTVRALTDLAARHDLVVVVGLALLDPEGRLRNSAVLVDGDGPAAVYDKVHLWGREPDVFTAGDAPPPVVATRHGRVGLMVCYDLEFPEWVRRAALDGAELVCVPVNWPDPGRPDGERPVETLTAQVAAATNRVYVAVADRVGDERGTRWIGGSVIAGPDGYPLVVSRLDGSSQTLLADCDLASARDKALSRHNDRFADRRPHLYSS
ncbi:nitrilase-related carbon-nitrogen hydrolase [Nocardioides antri]|uniref:Carbon-nitrogen hydrolase n=1 Tax=Nocardioides antri TaxID=2607659 RepID=A0A5B1M9B2_9ACTN|nr:nitrilase-related carbon-nitrogen hydrolase [Nocardioides antri]KAA1429224.1 carbon-nitrogen hydrolase [Nocardioides antri]